MNESILVSVKKKLGLPEVYDAYDPDIIMDINSVFAVLHQMGIGPDTPFSIEDDSKLWSDFTTDARLEMIKTYMYMKVRLLFDPPTSSVLLDSLNKNIQEFEWRMYSLANFNEEENNAE